MTTDASATASLDCELCIVGAGYAALNGLNAAAKYLTKGARVVVIDKNATWGGQWLHQYAFVRLHQPYRMFTAGDQRWTLDRDRSHLATRREVLDHFASVPAISARHLEIKPLFGHVYGGHSLREGRVEVLAAEVSGTKPPTRIRAKRLLHATGVEIEPLPPFTLSSTRVRSVAVSDPLLSDPEFLSGRDPVYIIGSGKTAMDCARHLIQPRGAERREVNVIAGSGMWFFVRDNIYPPGAQRYVRGALNTAVFLSMCELYDGKNEVEVMEHLRRGGYAETVWASGGNCRLGMLSLAERDELRAGVDRVFHGHLVDVEGTTMTLRSDGTLQEHRVPEGAYFINCTTHLLPRPHRPLLQESGLVCSPQFALGLTGTSAYFITHMWFRDQLGAVAHDLFRFRIDVEPKLSFATHLGLMALANVSMVTARLPKKIAVQFEGDLNKWYPLYRRLPLIARLTAKRGMLLDKAERILGMRFSDGPDHDQLGASSPTLGTRAAIYELRRQPMSTSRELPTYAGRPFVGHLHAFRADPVEFLLRLAKENPELVRVRVGVWNRVFTSSPDHIHSLLVEHAADVTKSLSVQLFAAPLIGDGLLRLEGGTHKQRRRMLAPAFMPRRIASYADEMVLRAQASADRMLQQTRIDVDQAALQLTMEIVAKTLFDAEISADAANVGAALTDAMSCMMKSMMGVVPLPPQVPSPSNLRTRRAVRRLDEVVYRMIRERRRAAVDRGDVLSMLLAARDEDDGSGLDDRAVRDEAMTLFLAGHETTANTLTWALYLLARNPDVRTRLEQEIDALGGRTLGAADLPALPYTLQVVKETLRLMPPAYLTGRILRKALRFSEYTLPAGCTVMVNIIGMHRRADLFPDPERFDPSRFAAEREKLLPRHAFLPFGAGPRVCIGNHFAWMESQLVLATWLQRLRFEPVASEPPGYGRLITLRPKHGITMHVSARMRPQPSAAVPA